MLKVLLPSPSRFEKMPIHFSFNTFASAHGNEEVTPLGSLPPSKDGCRRKRSWHVSERLCGNDDSKLSITRLEDRMRRSASVPISKATIKEAPVSKNDDPKSKLTRTRHFRRKSTAEIKKLRSIDLVGSNNSLSTHLKSSLRSFPLSPLQFGKNGEEGDSFNEIRKSKTSQSLSDTSSTSIAGSSPTNTLSLVKRTSILKNRRGSGPQSLQKESESVISSPESKKVQFFL